MPIKKEEGWKEDLTSLVKEGKTYKEVVSTLKEKYGEEGGSVGLSTYGKLRKSAFPEDKRDFAIHEVAEKHGKTDKKKLKTLRQWNSAKQKTADASEAAKVINQAVYTFVPCPTNKLEQEDIDKINPGGGIVATVSYLYPGFDMMNNPVIIFVIRALLTVIKIRKVCYDVKAKLLAKKEEEAQESETSVALQVIQSDISQHPLDRPEIRQLWEEEGK